MRMNLCETNLGWSLGVVQGTADGASVLSRAADADSSGGTGSVAIKLPVLLLCE